MANDLNTDFNEQNITFMDLMDETNLGNNLIMSHYEQQAMIPVSRFMGDIGELNGNIGYSKDIEHSGIPISIEMKEAMALNQIQSRKSKVWKYYSEFKTEVGLDKCFCILCGRQYFNTTSTSALMRHLLVSHNISMESDTKINPKQNKEAQQKKNKKDTEDIVVNFGKTSKLFSQFFEMKQIKELNRYACKLCDIDFSLKTSSSVLLLHVKSKHFNQLKITINPDQCPTNNTKCNEQINVVPKQSNGNSNLWKFYNKIRDDSKKGYSCIICSVSYSKTTNNITLANHLMKVHSIDISNYDNSLVEHQLVKYNVNPMNNDMINKQDRIFNSVENKNISIMLLNEWIKDNSKLKQLINSTCLKELIFCIDDTIGLENLEHNIKANEIVDISNEQITIINNDKVKWKEKENQLFFLKSKDKLIQQCLLCFTKFSKETNEFSLNLHLHESHSYYFSKDLYGFFTKQDTNLAMSLLATKFLFMELKEPNIFQQDIFLKFLVMKDIPLSIFNPDKIYKCLQFMYNQASNKLIDIIVKNNYNITLKLELINIDINNSCLIISICLNDEHNNPNKYILDIIPFTITTKQLKLSHIENKLHLTLINFKLNKSKVCAVLIYIEYNSDNLISELKVSIHKILEDSNIYYFECLYRKFNYIIKTTFYQHPIINKILPYLLNHQFSIDQDIFIILNKIKQLINNNLINSTTLGLDNIEYTCLQMYIDTLINQKNQLDIIYNKSNIPISEAFLSLRNSLLNVQLILSQYYANHSIIFSELNSNIQQVPDTTISLSLLLDPRYKLFSDNMKHLYIQWIQNYFIRLSLKNPSQLNNDNNNVPLDQELDFYLVLPNVNTNINPLLWWQINANTMPIMTTVAMHVLSISSFTYFSNTNIINLNLNDTNIKYLSILWAFNKQ